MAKRICCPNILCKSTDVVPVSTKTKFSLRKAVIDGTVGSLFTPLEQLLAQQAALTESMEKRNLYAKIAGKCLRKSLNSGGNTFMEILAKKFEEELKLKMLRAKKECKYNPTRFNQMLATYGGVETAKRLISNARKTGNTSEGFSTLFLCGRLDVSMEDSVCKVEYASLFTDEEIAYCKEVLGIDKIQTETD